MFRPWCLKIIKNVKGYARLSPDLSMDFVRLIYFVVFLMLDKMHNKIFGKSTFLTCVETIFRSTIFDKIFLFLNNLECLIGP